MKESFRNQRDSLPDTHLTLKIANLPFDLSLTVSKMAMDDEYPGKVLLARSDMPDTFESVIAKALADKLPKLSATDASKRILLLEQDGFTPGFQEFTKALRSVENHHERGNSSVDRSECECKLSFSPSNW